MHYNAVLEEERILPVLSSVNNKMHTGKEYTGEEHEGPHSAVYFVGLRHNVLNAMFLLQYYVRRFLDHERNQLAVAPSAPLLPDATSLAQSFSKMSTNTTALGRSAALIALAILKLFLFYFL